MSDQMPKPPECSCFGAGHAGFIDPRCPVHAARCQNISPSPWGRTQCALAADHKGRHRYGPDESTEPAPSESLAEKIAQAITAAIEDIDGTPAVQVPGLVRAALLARSFAEPAPDSEEES